MKLVTFSYKNTINIGAIIDEHIIYCKDNKHVPNNMIDFLSAGQSAKETLQSAINNNASHIPFSDVTLLAPIPRPGKFLGISLNYADHIAETEREKPEFPTFFSKQNSCVIAHGEAIHRPVVSEKLDYEGELAFIIGKRCKHVPLEQAHQVIAGYTIVNDVSVRDWQFRSPTWMIGKSFDTHGPMGPWIVTADEIDNPHNLSIKTWINDELRQNSNTKHMLVNCFEMVTYLSKAMTLEPGDVISTGTPSGVGVKMQPRGYMTPGQTVKIQIESIGTLINPVIDEPYASIF